MHQLLPPFQPSLPLRQFRCIRTADELSRNRLYILAFKRILIARLEFINTFGETFFWVPIPAHPHSGRTFDNIDYL